MKMAQFLDLSDDDKVALLEGFECAGKQIKYSKVTEDKGMCSQCGKPTDVGDFCFGCHKLVCQKCIEKEPHLSDCCPIVYTMKAF